MDLALWCWLSVAGNVVAAAISVFGCWLLSQIFRRHRIFETSQPLTATDILYSISAVALNSLVAVIGWILWKQGWIEIRHPSLLRTVADTLLLIFIMDLAMYGFHRIAHHPLLYGSVHRLHHTHESTNPLSLFVLNPFEALGFGFLMIAVLILIPFSGAAVVAYLSFNLAFGTVGHLGVEPMPRGVMRIAPFRYLGTSTFHGMHHADRRYNFGFYTTVWDRLFNTLDPGYEGRFLTCSRKS